MGQKKNKIIWFRAKRYGWGWYPITIEGWFITIAYIIFFVTGEILFINYLGANPSWIGITFYVLFVVFITYLLIATCYKKGEKPGWHWGNK